MHNQKKDNNQFKNNKKPELTENLTAWNSDNQEVKHSSILVGGAEMDIQVERTCIKEADCTGKVGLVDHETKDSKLLSIKYCGGFEGGINTQSHRRVHWKVGLEQSQ